MSRWCFACGVVLFAAVCQAAEVKLPSADWPQFRGPNRDDLSSDKGLLKEWPKDGPPQVWKATGIGSGFSSVAVAGDKVFTMGNKDGSCHVYAIDRETGKNLWSTKVGR